MIAPLKNIPLLLDFTKFRQDFKLHPINYTDVIYNNTDYCLPKGGYLIYSLCIPAFNRRHSTCFVSQNLGQPFPLIPLQQAGKHLMCFVVFPPQKSKAYNVIFSWVTSSGLSVCKTPLCSLAHLLASASALLLGCASMNICEIKQ